MQPLIVFYFFTINFVEVNTSNKYCCFDKLLYILQLESHSKYNEWYRPFVNVIQVQYKLFQMLSYNYITIKFTL